MKLPLITAILLLSACALQKNDLNYPIEMEEIKEVTLTRPDKQSSGKMATSEVLSKEETLALLEALGKAKAVGPMKFEPDYFIVFTTKANETQRIKINGNKIKGYDSDYSYEIERLKFLDEF